MSDAAGLRTIRTEIPARLDRLPWSRFHWLIVFGLGTAWILDGLEVTMVGNVSSRLTEPGSGIEITAGQIGLAGSIYVVGACLGALVFGQLTDWYGRKRLLLITLSVYLIATAATAASFEPWFFYLCRFFTGVGIGGEYAAINSAIDELIPARYRGRVDLAINGGYWLGAAGGALLAVVLLNTAVVAADLGWRIAFLIGVVLGFAVLLVRRHVPESPRWLFIHGRDREAENTVEGIERAVTEQTGRQLARPEQSITVRQRRSISIAEIARTAFRTYPRRSLLCLALFLGQAFLYNAVTFDLGTLLSEFFAVDSGAVPYYFAIYALASLAGPLTLGWLFDTVGRKTMISGCYLGSAALLTATGLLFVGGGLTSWTFLLMLVVTFFFASTGASAAYLTVSEIFPMETRALAIAFFYAVGTAAGGVAGPVLFGRFIESGSAELVALGFYIGAAIMALGGIAELAFGIKAEGRSLEDIATPLTAQQDQSSS
ncbi:MFS transporter [Saccharopolyspora sp. CA-218241]|uniref:MFS transporter n=1 Tax=Saccharopolyspora sp. CA-218241 TaxID=3240027 RepID=UPI003D96E6AA